MKETNEERFTKYFCQYSDDLFLYLVRDLGVERETAIDLMEDVWVVFWEKFHDIRDLKDAQIRKWLWKTAYYKVRNHKRRKNYYSEILYPMEEMEGFYADEEKDDFEREILEECIMALRPVEREVINKRREELPGYQFRNEQKHPVPGMHLQQSCEKTEKYGRKQADFFLVKS